MRNNTNEKVNPKDHGNELAIIDISVANPHHHHGIYPSSRFVNLFCCVFFLLFVGVNLSLSLAHTLYVRFSVALHLFHSLLLFFATLSQKSATSKLVFQKSP